MASRKCARCGWDFVPKKKFDYRNKICIDCGGHNSYYPKYPKKQKGGKAR